MYRLIIPILILLMPACGGHKPPCVVIIMIDTLRADHLTCYGYRRATSPRIDGLAKEGVVFKNVFAASPWTGPSVASIVTGKYPDEVGIHDLRDPLPEDAVTLAERLKTAGYDTAAVSSNAMAGPLYGHTQGYDEFIFDRYKGKEEEGRAPRPSFTADKVTDRALEWLENRERPFLLYVHYTDPHDPYLPPPSWRDQFLRDRPPLDEEFMARSEFTRGIPEPDVIERAKASYEAEIAFTDHEVGRLLDGLPEDAVIVLVGDHGEEFLEHGGFLHGHTLYQELLRVPLILQGPDVPQGMKIDDPVSQVDIVPTVLDLAGFPAAGDLSGRNLMPYLKEGNPKPAFLFSVLESRKYRLLSARRGPWKLLYLPSEKRHSLYHLESDPLEERDRSKANPEVAASLLKAIEAREDRVIPAPSLDSPDLEKEREEELRALGYIK